MAELFSDNEKLERIPMPGAEVYLLRHLALDQAPDRIKDELIRETPWRQEAVSVWGKHYLQPRLIAWYGDPGCRYSYSGLSLDPLPWTELLLALRARVERVVDERFNSVLLNYYRDNNDSMGFHSDDERELGPRPIIASLSLGEERAIVFKAKANKELKPIRIMLGSGSLLVMKGDTQANWKHAILKERRPCGPRVNLTFRRIQI
ncbi:MAG TPA: alpha-ketoglutarate-dependent dioxygenase AlkB [Alphaproteobacteria bacterium]